MHLIIPRQDFFDLLNRAQSAISPRPPTPLLSNCVLEAVNDELILTATDLLIMVRCFSAPKIIQEGSITLPLKKLLLLVREFTAPNVEIRTLSPVTAEIRSGSSICKLNGLGIEGFPKMASFDGALRCFLPQPRLKELLFRTSFAAARDDNRHVLMGVHFRFEDGKIIAVGADGKLLAEATMDHPLKEMTANFTLPLRAVDELSRLLSDDEEEEAELKVTSERLSVSMDSCLFSTKLLDGDYPEYKRIIPNSTPFKVELHKEELRSLLRQVSLFVDETTHPVCFCFKKGELTLIAKSSQIGEASVKMAIHYDQPQLDVSFNPHHIVEILRRCETEAIQLALFDAFNPGIITESGGERKIHTLYVVMPLRR